MTRRDIGLSLLEVVVATTILAALVVPAFEMFSMQRHQVASAQRDLLLHGYSLQRLAEIESRLNIDRFPGSSKVTSDVTPSGEGLVVRETLSVASVPDCTGLWRLTVDLSYADASSRGAPRTLSITKLAADRDLPTRLEAVIR